MDEGTHQIPPEIPLKKAEERGCVCVVVFVFQREGEERDEGSQLEK